MIAADGYTIVMFGGSLVSNNKITNELHALDIRTWTWFQPTVKATTTIPPPVRDHQCVVIGDQFLSLFGFNGNQAPASSGSASGSSPIPPPPPIYVLSISQWAWSTQYKPLPGTPAPPVPPVVPTDGSKGGINAAGLAFGLIFGLAFLGVIVYLVISHKRKQKKKAETLALYEIQERQREETRLEKERQKRWQQQMDAPLPPTPPMAHTQQRDYPNAHEYNGGYHQPPPSSSSSSARPYQGQDPFRDHNYSQNQHAYSHAAPYSNYSQQAPMHQGSAGFIPEEMGYTSPTFPAAHQGHGAFSDNSKVPLEYEGTSQQAGNLTRGVGSKSSFIEPGSSYR